MAVSVLVWALLGPPMMWLLHRAITGGHVPTEPLRTGRARRERLVAPAMRAGVLPPDPEPDVWRRALTAEVREWNGQRWVAGVFAGVGAGLIGAAAVVANDNAPGVWLVATLVAAEGRGRLPLVRSGPAYRTATSGRAGRAVSDAERPGPVRRSGREWTPRRVSVTRSGACPPGARCPGRHWQGAGVSAARIAPMVSGVIVVGAILLGLPLLAWWLGNRRFWSRLRPGAEPDPRGDAMRRFGLTPQEAALVESAVTWGSRLEDERLRPAAVAWAERLVEQTEARRRVRSPWGRAAVLLGVVGVLVAGLYWMTLSEGEFP